MPSQMNVLLRTYRYHSSLSILKSPMPPPTPNNKSFFYLLNGAFYDNGITLESFRAHTSFGRFLVHNLFIRENLLNRNVSETK